ncbi:MAG: hypothetical protein ACPGOY_00995 [Rhodospirillaceae bacterium]
MTSIERLYVFSIIAMWAIILYLNANTDPAELERLSKIEPWPMP